MQLISGLVSNNAAKVRMVLAIKGAAYETVEIPWTRASAWEPKPSVLIENNPRAEVPVLIDNGLTLWDSTVINEYLEEKYPEPALLPQDRASRGLCRLWEDEGDHNQVHVGVLIREVFMGQSGSALSPDAQLAVSSLQAFYKRLDQQLANQDYLCGQFSLADISVFLTVAFASTLGAAVALPRVQAWYTRVMEQPQVKAEFEQMMAGVAAL